MSPNFRLTGLPQVGGSPLAVLFVDPDFEGAQLLSRALPSNALTAVVPTAYGALQAMQGRLPTLLVTELDLPDASGVELLRRVHADQATRHVLLMVITRRNSLHDKIAAFEAGADDYLVKPLDPQTFLVHVQLLNRFSQVVGRQQYLPQHSS